MRRLSVLIAVFAAFLLLSTSLVSAQGETLLVETQSTETTVATDDLAESDQLAEDFIRNIMPSRGRKMLKSRGQRELNLTGATATLYSLLLNDITDIANGNRADTDLAYDFNEFYEQTSFTKEDLQVDSLVEDNALAPDAIAAINQRLTYDLQAIVSTLLSRYPYELYWYDKTIGVASENTMQYSYSYDGTTETITVTGTEHLRFAVSADYAPGHVTGGYTYDTSYGQSAQAAAAKASQIVATYASSSDEDKLRSYASEICGLVSYNDEAAAGGIAYGNPWQLVWVFDENPDTNVVCEGYSKAFQYLCDLSNFTGDISVITVTGAMAGGTGEGPHMWNVVRLDDGFNYLVDVTNIDEGTIGYPNQLMLVKSSSGSVDDGYSFVTSGGMITYVYDNGTKSQFSASELTLSDVSDKIVVAIDETSFPDDTFRAYIIDNFDLNQDGSLDESESLAVTEISVPEMNISSLDGIEFFPNLNYLYAVQNSISEIDVSGNPSLAFLYLNWNQLSSIDVSSLTELKYLWVPFNPIDSIDVSNNAKLDYLWVEDTNISSIDVRNNPQLRVLDCQTTPICELDVSQNLELVQLICQNAPISSLDLSNNLKLEQLWITNTDIITLDLSNNGKLWQLFCGENKLACLDLSNNPLITDLRALSICIVLPTGTTSYDMTLFDGFVPERSSLWEGAKFDNETGLLTNIENNCVRYRYDCGNSHSINVSIHFADTISVNSETFPDDAFRQYILDNFAPDATLTTNQQLDVTYIDVSGMNVNSLQGIEFFPSLQNLYCSDNPITQLHLNSHNLFNLIIRDTQITSIEVGFQPGLAYLDISRCPIKTIDLSLFPSLVSFYCDLADLSALNIQVCPALKNFNCNMCHIPELDLTGLTLDSNVSYQSISEPIPVYCANGYYIANISSLVTHLDRINFSDCSSYNSVTGTVLFDSFPGTVIHYLYDTGIPNYTFEVSLTTLITDAPYQDMSTISIPSNTLRIESEAFAGIGAEVIIIPENCEYVARDAFDNCENLVYIVNRSTVAINVPDGVTLISER